MTLPFHRSILFGNRGNRSSAARGSFSILRKNFLHLLVWLVLLGNLPAFGQSPPPEEGTSPVPVPGMASPGGSPTAAAPVVTNGGYRLKVDDQVRITVFGEDDLTTETRISQAGTINFPLIGSVRLAGRTVDEATAEIRQRLDKDYIVNPQVTMVMLDFAKEWVTVLGEVQKPGQVQIPEGGTLDLLGAIALAGGYTRIADPSHVIVRRQTGGEDKVLRVNARELARDSRVQQFQVYPGDTINVGQSFF
jgi:polysaccharide export outer membrane protein